MNAEMVLLSPNLSKSTEKRHNRNPIMSFFFIEYLIIFYKLLDRLDNGI